MAAVLLMPARSPTKRPNVTRENIGAGGELAFVDGPRDVIDFQTGVERMFELEGRRRGFRFVN